jgi:hypothetical protein
MNEAARIARNTQRLTTLYAPFGKRLKRMIVRLEADGLRPRIQDAWRSPEDQRRAYEAGHSKLLFGFHNVTGQDGTPQALAVDLLDDNAPLNAGRSYILRLAAAAQAEGLVTGVRWGVPKAMRDAIDAAIASGNWDAPVKVGWDPLHVEATGITVSKAKAGKRPT